MCDIKRRLSQMDDFNEKMFEGKPWAEKLLSESIKLTKKAVANWCHIVCKIGEAEVDLDDYVTIFLQQIETLYEDLIADVDTIHEKSLDKIMKLLEKLENLCRDLHVPIPTFNYEGVPLSEVRLQIVQKVDEFEALAQIRRREFSELQQKELKLCACLGRAPRLLPGAPLPLPPELEELKAYVENLETEAMEREEVFFQLKEKIVEIVSELEMCPNLEFEKDILNLSNTQVRITDAEMEQLRQFHDQLVKRLADVTEEVEELRSRIDDLWKKLEVDLVERDDFRARHVGHSLKTLEALKEELNRLKAMKKAKLQSFILKQRDELEEWWEKCHCTQKQRDDFTFYYSDCFTEDLFDIHEREIEKWKNYHEENSEIFALLKEFKTLWTEQIELESNSKGANRYKNRGGQLLIEERKRNKLKKRLPVVEDKLRSLAQAYLVRNGQEFETFGQTIDDYIQQLHENKERKLSAKKQLREQQPSCSSRLPTTPRHCSKRKVTATPATEPSKKAKLAVLKKVSKTGLPKFNTSKTKNNRRRSSAHKQRLRSRLFKSSDKENQSNVSTTYHDFEKEISARDACRSTIGGTIGLQVTNPEGIRIKQENFAIPSGIAPLPRTPRPKNPSKF
ncbi:protein regulator of cytokinesis 1 isoform X2 [Tribolium castaneum]|uniref:protein regulator of cytokinesis 1 isoform X2 n=1 Tax=Tribolium castaneum TaxID=7070 RepID=UPI00077DA543|nr:PREDICTED: protein regulator of cytokinesis 1 isoform X2 [Tribolium castaneum]|eukprot:XP_015839966.1 PREDICTED: protein regulator of cytokinesis 1 isoform X2 [Tribolium castaneum]